MTRHVNGEIPARRLYRLPEALVLLSISRSAFYEEKAAGRIHTVHRGRTLLVSAESIDAYVALLEAEAGIAEEAA